MDAKSGLALNRETQTVCFVINKKKFEFTNDEFDELITLYTELCKTNYFGEVLCTYRDDKDEIHRLCKE